MNNFDALQIRNWSRVSISPVKSSKITRAWVKDIRKRKGEMKCVWSYMWKHCIEERVEDYLWGMFLVPNEQLEHIHKIPQELFSVPIEWDIKVEAKRIRKIPYSGELHDIMLMLERDGKWKCYDFLNNQHTRKLLMF
mgnify:CR=1 FL=1